MQSGRERFLEFLENDKKRETIFFFFFLLTEALGLID